MARSERCAGSRPSYATARVTLDGALAAGEGMARHPAGTREHRWFADWAAHLKATEWAMVRCEDRYRRRVAELSGGVPVYDGGDAVAIAAE